MGPFVLLLLGCFFRFSEVQPANIQANSTNDVMLVTTPTSIHQGFTRQLDVTCSFTQHQGSAFSTVMSIILSKAPDYSSNSSSPSSTASSAAFTELAAVNSVSAGQVIVKNDLGANVTGQLMQSGPSFISFHWVYPTEALHGSYKCEAYGMDHIGHPMTNSVVKEVQEKVIDLDDVLEKMKETEQKHSQEIQKLIALTGDQKSQITVQKTQINQLMTRLDESRDAIMESQTTYGGHAYFLSRPVTWNTHKADSWCRLFGGYLVEVNSAAEYQFVWDWVKVKGFGEWVFISGSDEGHEGHYTFFHSGQPVSYLDWSVGEPNQGTSGNCMFFNIKVSSGMFDGVCNEAARQPNDGLARFICEKEP